MPLKLRHRLHFANRRAPPVDREVAKATGELLSGSGIVLVDGVSLRQTSEVEAVPRRSSAHRQRFAESVVDVDRQPEMEKGGVIAKKRMLLTRTAFKLARPR